MPAVGGKPPIAEKQVAELAVAAMAFGDAAEAHRGDGRAAVADEFGTGLGGADLGDRRGNGNGKLRAHRHQRLDRGVADGDPIDQIDVGQQWRAREHHRGDFRLVGGERGDDLHRRVAAHRQRLGHGEPDLRGRIVEKQRQGGVGRAKIVEVELSVDIGPGQCACSGSPFAHTGRLHPLQEMLDNHATRTPHLRCRDVRENWFTNGSP